MSVDSSPRTSLRAQAREFAGDVLANARAVTDTLPTATERYRATRPFYRQMVEAGFLRRLIPQALGGDGTGAAATAALAEELVAGDPSVALNLFSTGLGLAPLLRAGSPAQRDRFLRRSSRRPAPRSPRWRSPSPAAPRTSTSPAGCGRRPDATTTTGSSTGRSSGSRTRPGGTAPVRT
jgi:butyryl-CoA dehydrogenase